jgi:hypothetical protein
VLLDKAVEKVCLELRQPAIASGSGVSSRRVAFLPVIGGMLEMVASPSKANQERAEHRKTLQEGLYRVLVGHGFGDLLNGT